MNIVLPICWALFFLFLIWKLPFFKIQGIAQWIIVAFFICKIGASWLLDYIYTDYYTTRSDVFKYYNDALALFDSIHYSLTDFLKILFGIDMDSPSIQQYIANTDDWTREYNYGYIVDNQTITRFNMVIMLFSWGNIGVHYLFADFISMISYFLIFKSFSILFDKKYVLLPFIFLIPSSILWNAAMLKEVIVMFGIGLSVYGMTKTHISYSWENIIILLLGIFILVGIKIYILVAILPAIIGYFLCKKFQTIKPWFIYTSIIMLGVLLLGVLDFLFHTIPFFESFAGKRGDSINLALAENAGSILPLEKIESTPWNFIKETPTAIWNTIALPYIWNFKGLIQIVPALESLLFFILLGLTIVFHQKPNEQQRNFIWFCICFSTILIWEIGISTAVVGGIVRYKIPIFPFLYTSLALMVDWKKIISH